jgi:hypothetical protein
VLDPYDRRLLVEAVHPPEDHSLDCAVVTSFSLDLEAMLAIPLALSLPATDGEPRTADPLTLLDALRRHAGNLHVFCQADGIQVPSRHHLLFSALEESVVPVRPPAGLCFHPKVWVLRFLGPSGKVLYRVLCNTRNLTFDRSWDLMLALEGQVHETDGGRETVGPLVALLDSLPAMALRTLGPRASAALGVIGRELTRVRFDLPAPFESLRFWASDVEGSPPWPFPEAADRVLVISPFVGAAALRRLTRKSGRHVLISRPDSLEGLSAEDLRAFDKVYILDPTAETPVAEDAGSQGDSLNGLHAKLYVMERGARASVWVGSANATEAAFGGNVEVLAELQGPRTRCGVDAILASRKGMTSFVDLLQPYRPPETPGEKNGDLARVEGWFGEARQALLAAPVTARASSHDTDRHVLALVLTDGATIDFPKEVEVTCWPIMLAETRARPIKPGARGVIADFGAVTFEALTTFYAFRLRASSGRVNETTTFVLSLPLAGQPSDRTQRILKSLLKDRHAVLRYLLLILAPPAMESLPPTTGTGGDASDLLPWSGRGPGLLERLLAALVGSPSRLEDVARLLKDLDSDNTGGRDLLPEGFQSVWEPVWKAYQGSRK